jgi:hypothetical protein
MHTQPEAPNAYARADKQTAVNPPAKRSSDKEERHGSNKIYLFARGAHIRHVYSRSTELRISQGLNSMLGLQCIIHLHGYYSYWAFVSMSMTGAIARC